MLGSGDNFKIRAGLLEAGATFQLLALLYGHRDVGEGEDGIKWR